MLTSFHKVCTRGYLSSEEMLHQFIKLIPLYRFVRCCRAYSQHTICAADATGGLSLRRLGLAARHDGETDRLFQPLLEGVASTVVVFLLRRDVFPRQQTAEQGKGAAD